MFKRDVLLYQITKERGHETRRQASKQDTIQNTRRRELIGACSSCPIPNCTVPVKVALFAPESHGRPRFRSVQTRMRGQHVELAYAVTTAAVADPGRRTNSSRLRLDAPFAPTVPGPHTLHRPFEFAMQRSGGARSSPSGNVSQEAGFGCALDARHPGRSEYRCAPRYRRPWRQTAASSRGAAQAPTWMRILCAS